MKYFIKQLFILTFVLSCLGYAQAEPREVKIASHVSKYSPLYAQAELFAKKVEDKLPGQFKFKIFPGGQLGKEKALIANVQAGSIDMIIVASGILKLDGKLGIFDLPWLFNDREQVKKVMASGLEKKIRNRIEKVGNIKVIGVYENGFRHIINSKRKVSEPFDLDGLKVRISGGKFRQGVFQKMGATPQKIPWGETFTALQSGVVDGAEAAAYGFYEQKMDEVARFLSLTSHVYTPSFLIASKTFINSLNNKQRKIFEEVGKEITEKSYDIAAKLENKYLKSMGNKLKVNKVKLDKFKKSTSSSYDDYIKKYGNEYLEIIKQSSK